MACRARQDVTAEYGGSHDSPPCHCPLSTVLLLGPALEGLPLGLLSLVGDCRRPGRYNGWQYLCPLPSAVHFPPHLEEPPPSACRSQDCSPELSMLSTPPPTWLLCLCPGHLFPTWASTSLASLTLAPQVAEPFHSVVPGTQQQTDPCTECGHELSLSREPSQAGSTICPLHTYSEQFLPPVTLNTNPCRPEERQAAGGARPDANLQGNLLVWFTRRRHTSIEGSLSCDFGHPEGLPT